MPSSTLRQKGLCIEGVRSSSQSKSAFTILEVALATAVLALALMSVIPVMQGAFKHVDTARSIEIAGNILQCELEKERLFVWDTVSNAAYTPTIDTSFTRVPSIAGRFTLTRQVTVVPNRSNEMVQIKLTVLWRSLDGANLSRSYTTYYGKNGLYDYYYDKS